MFNTNFKNVSECLTLNKMKEDELIVHLKRYFDNQNYRSKYNHTKNELLKKPEIKAMLKKLSGK